tara:strand:+ start:348 stop:623 length:276 start_codon:yes stop_codon:yes gene_type:complete
MPSKLTRDQEREVYRQFVDIVVDGMDIKTLVQIVTDQLNDYYEDCSSIELKEEIDNYDDELYRELVENVQIEDADQQYQHLQEIKYDREVD